MRSYFSSVTSSVSSLLTTEKVDKPGEKLTPAMLQAKKLLEEGTDLVPIPPSSLENWYGMALTSSKQGKYAKEITREEVIEMGALQLQIVYGDSDPTKHKIGFLDEKTKGNIIHNMFKRDVELERECYHFHAGLKGMSSEDAKSRYVTIMRIVKRVAENIFDGFLYSADKIEIRDVIVVVSDTVFIMDSKTQEIVQKVPIESFHGWAPQHTSTTERDKLRKILGQGNVGHLHQLILDMGPGTPVIRILSGKRDELQAKLQSHLQFLNERKKEKKLNEAKVEVTNNTSITTTTTTTTTSTSTSDISKYPPGSIAAQCWLFDEKEVTTQPVFVKFASSKVHLLSTTEDDKIILEFPIDWIKTWRQEPIPYDIQFQLTKTTGVPSLQQLYIDLHTYHAPVRVLSDNLWKLRHGLKTAVDVILNSHKEQFQVQYLNDEGNVEDVVLRFDTSTMVLFNNESNRVVKEMPLSNIQFWRIDAISNELKDKFKATDALFFNTGTSDIMIASDEVTLISIEFKSIIEETAKNTPLQSSSSTSLLQKFKNALFPPKPVDIKQTDCVLANHSKEGSNGDNENDIENTAVSVLIENQKLVIYKKTPTGLNKIQEINWEDVEGWVFGIKVSEDHKGGEGLLVSSNKASGDEMQTIQQIMMNSKTESSPKTTEKHDDDQTTTVDGDKLTEDGSGSECEIGDFSNSNSHEEM
eukprot:TRINITY_DN4089_c0_g1_i1.p1 TRINITY_DN4089_c0_g1~~TRINITY_DN4089_c0_g1_i1.p1  ORF type:complete len:697 (-),score=152.45 TRINITY_DN4089_c0_g1_i1:100-2190(-)